MSRAAVRLRWFAGAADPAWQAVLSAPERTRHAAMRHPGAAAAFLASRALLRHLLSEATPSVGPAEWDFADGSNGKPACVPSGARPAPRFNVAHTDGLVVAAVSLDAEVGVDVEDASRDAAVDRLVARYFAAEEQAWLASLDPATRRRRFFDVWVLKEAAIKLRGATLGGSIGKVVVLPGDGPGGLAPTGGDGTYHRWEVGPHVVALAVGADEADVDAGPWSGPVPEPMD